MIELPSAWKPAAKPVPVNPVWSVATPTPLSWPSSASHSEPWAQLNVAGANAGAAVTPLTASDTFWAVKGPEPTLYFSVALPVLMVSQPSTVLEVKSV